jgi:hypothetical protein
MSRATRLRKQAVIAAAVTSLPAMLASADTGLPPGLAPLPGDESIPLSDLVSIDAGPWRDVTAAAHAQGLMFDAMYVNPFDGKRVIVSWARRDDGKRWVHVSVSHPSRIPSYEELAEVKRRFIGSDRYAVMVFPEESKHVNIHPRCLHLWHCVDGHPLPEFSGELVGGGRTI